jgi:VanZ family protein
MPEVRTSRHTKTRRLLSVAFVLYALALISGTHWPNPIQLDVPPQSDKVVHFVAFFFWMLIFRSSRALGSISNSTSLYISIAMCYAAFDEITQGLPGINRTVSIGDLLANFAGILTAAVIFSAVTRHKTSP